MPASVKINQGTDLEKGPLECTVCITGVNKLSINGGVHITVAGSTPIEGTENRPPSLSNSSIHQNVLNWQDELNDVELSNTVEDQQELAAEEEEEEEEKEEEKFPSEGSDK